MANEKGGIAGIRLTIDGKEYYVGIKRLNDTTFKPKYLTRSSLDALKKIAEFMELDVEIREK